MFEKMIVSGLVEFETLPEPISGLFKTSEDSGDEAEMANWVKNAWMTTHA